MIGIYKVVGEHRLVKLEGLQVVRAVAAILVVVAHAFHQLDQLKVASPPAAIRQFPWQVGVDLFFVLSGFLMWATVAGRLGAPRAATQFLIRRIIRIAPIYWLYTLLLSGIILVVPAAVNTTELSWWQFVQSMLFIPYEIATGKYRPILMQGWTLNYEMYFYVVMALAIAVAKPRVVTFLTAYFIATSLLFFWIALPSRLEFWANAICLEFVIGLHLARVYLAGVRIRVVWGLALAGLAFGAVVLSSGIADDGVSPWRFLRLGVPAGLGVACLALTQSELLDRFWRYVSPLGDASYSLYLSHPFVLVAVSIVIRKLGLTGLPVALLLAGYVIACVVVGQLSYLLLERPTTHWLNSRLGTLGSRVQEQPQT